MKFACFSTAFFLAAALALASMLSPATRGQAGLPADRSRRITPAQAKTEVDRLTQELAEARKLAKRIGDPAVRDRMELILSRAELHARDLSIGLAVAAQTPPAPMGPSALPASEFEKLIGGLKKEAFDAGKLVYIENFATTRPLSCEQAAGLLRCFNFDQDRVKAAKHLYPRMVDRQNFNEVLATFTFDTGKAEVRKAVGLK